MDVINIILPVIALVTFLLLLAPRINKNKFWQATVTPLASIIGSGFLIVAPLLAEIVGNKAIYVMLAIVCIAFGIGAVIRFNIKYAEPILKAVNCDKNLILLERLSKVALTIAYIISITFYLRLLSSFVMEGFHIQSDFWAQSLTTAILLFIGITGFRFGLRGLERLEIFSVSLKLAIIAALIIGLLLHNISHGFSLSGLQGGDFTITERLRMLAGMLLIVQGFETSRYLGKEYSASVRIKSMRLAQIISGVIYILFVLMLMPLLHHFGVGNPDETAIISLSAKAAMVLPFMLIIAAVMSQFSASIADMLGAGGLIEEQSREKIKGTTAYIAIALISIFLVWSSNIFEIVTHASRAFAAYYFLQTLIALRVIKIDNIGGSKVKSFVSVLMISILMFAALLFAIPAE